VFLLGILIKNSNQTVALIGFFLAIITMIFVVSFNLTGWTWYTFIGVIVCIFAGGILTKTTMAKS
jgi:hypothetical protein